MTSTALAIVGLGILVFLAHLFAVLFRHLRIPDVLPLMLIGLLIGPILKIVPLEAFGRVGTVLTTITLVVILFDGGLGLDFRTLGEGTLTGTRLTFVNFVATLSVVAAVGFVLFGLALNESLMLGAILGGTSSAVVIPLVARLHLESKTRTALLLESAFSDVLCIVVTFGLLQAAKAQAVKPLSVGLQIVASFLLAGAIGAAFALLWSALLRRVRQLENSLLLTPAFVMIVYGLTELAGYSGAISSLAFGVTLGNIRSLRGYVPHAAAVLRPTNLNDRERAFLSEATFLLKTFFFVYIGLSLRLADVRLLLSGLALSLLIFLLRIPVVRLSLGRTTRQSDAILAAVIVPKGLAAAVLAALPAEAGLAGGQLIRDSVFAAILFTVLFTAVLAFLVEAGIIPNLYQAMFHHYSASSDLTLLPHGPAVTPTDESPPTGSRD